MGGGKFLFCPRGWVSRRSFRRFLRTGKARLPQLSPLQENKLLASFTGAFALGVALGLLFLIPSFTSAGSDCEGTTLQITACLQREYKELDYSMGELYRRILEGLGGPSGKKAAGSREVNSRDLLVSAQKAWLSFREEECRARSGYFAGGSMEKLELMGCRVELTKHRIKLLENWLELLER